MESFNVGLIFSFLVCLVILVAKARFIHRILKANTDVNVFNHSIALCFTLSGETDQFGIRLETLLKVHTRKGEMMFSMQVLEALSASRPLFGRLSTKPLLLATMLLTMPAMLATMLATVLLAILATMLPRPTDFFLAGFSSWSGQKLFFSFTF